MSVFRCASISSIYTCLSVSPSVGPWYFRISNLSASLVALHEKLKREDPNYFSILGLGVFCLKKWPKKLFDPKKNLTNKLFRPKKKLLKKREKKENLFFHPIQWNKIIKIFSVLVGFPEISRKVGKNASMQVFWVQTFSKTIQTERTRWLAHLPSFCELVYLFLREVLRSFFVTIWVFFICFR